MHATEFFEIDLSPPGDHSTCRNECPNYKANLIPDILLERSKIEEADKEICSTYGISSNVSPGLQQAWTEG